MNPTIIVRLIRLSFPIIIISILFKVMHWPYTQLLMTIGLGIIVLLYPVRFYLKKEKRIIDYVKLLVAIFLPLNTYLNLFHLPSHYILPIISSTSFLLYLLLELYNNYLNKESSKELTVFPFGVLSVIIAILLLGVFYRILHFENATQILITGFVLLFLYFIVDTFKLNK
ncbi:GldL-related protein [Flavobacterium sp.]|uniref:GldL-related protein n=1 Tax=Flavobacterium sp. TaxID=239 RepID=UPI004047FAF9